LHDWQQRWRLAVRQNASLSSHIGELLREISRLTDSG